MGCWEGSVESQSRKGTVLGLKSHSKLFLCLCETWVILSLAVVSFKLERQSGKMLSFLALSRFHNFIKNMADGQLTFKWLRNHPWRHRNGLELNVRVE